ncbi:MAG: Lrp/AsnC family transcriptional regulator [Conexivisphaerales archaeon]
MVVDEKDIAIINCLLNDGRQSYVDISGSLGLPRATVQERVKKLIDSGIIKKFTVKLDYSKLGRGVTSYIFVSFGNDRHVSQRELAERIAIIPNVFEVSVISGQWDILIKTRTSSVEEVGTMVIDTLRSMPGIQKTETCVSFQTIKEE